ncbi:hypothetical protein IAG41_16290 [Sphingomonas sp. JC676]|uniref:hypothetical protein n=1 Tax=Sphingomonas sp. JC676 TaxID=2768065 RepID=UPI001657A9EB|nr:hypothetical protein [Sphingomonas sp. JC676]MBC9033950.1 hypothetical protein [Sphingomonas sp. JC676]
MIAAALLLFAAQDVPADVQADDIVVTGQLLKLKVGLKTNRKGRAIACAIDRTSGDAGFDRKACETTVVCVNQGPRDHEAVSACVHDRMFSFARGRATVAAMEERE